jgi:hypothetical protein
MVSTYLVLCELKARDRGCKAGNRKLTSRDCHDTGRGGNISISDHGTTRDFAAAKAGLGSGKTYEAAKRVVENDANKMQVVGYVVG